MDTLLLKKYQTIKKGAPPHEQAAKVDLIVEVIGLSKQYDYKYWLRKVKKISYSDIISFCKEASNLPDKYSKGGYLTNKCKTKKSTN